MDKISGWVNLPTNQIVDTASLEQILAAGLIVIVFALGFISGNQR